MLKLADEKADVVGGSRLMIFVSGPYSGKDQTEIAAHVADAARVGREIMRRGHAVFVPHTMTHNWDIVEPGLEYEDFMALCFDHLLRCDAICMVGDWHGSDGAKREFDMAAGAGLDIYTDMSEVPDLRGRATTGGA